MDARRDQKSSIRHRPLSSGKMRQDISVSGREGIADLFQSAELLFEPLWETRIIMSNGLAQNLYWEVIRYLRFPYLMDIEKQRVICENLRNGQ